MKKDCSAIILAAGNAARMGQMKFSLKMKDGKIFLENIIEQFSAFGCTEIIVVVNSTGKSFLDQHDPHLPANVKIVLNEHPAYERFYSLQKGLSALGANAHVFIHNADNPFADSEVLEKLYQSRNEAEVVKPVFEGKGGHPVLISQKISNEITAEARNNWRLDDFLRTYPQKKVHVSNGNILVNINTFEDYQKL